MSAKIERIDRSEEALTGEHVLTIWWRRRAMPARGDAASLHEMMKAIQRGERPATELKAERRTFATKEAADRVYATLAREIGA
jgi:hypothetical protein